MKKWSLDGNLLEGEELLAVYPSIKPENQSCSKEKGNNGLGMETALRKIGNMLAVYVSNHKSIFHQQKKSIIH
jgi:hypothetical protein